MADLYENIAPRSSLLIKASLGDVGTAGKLADVKITHAAAIQAFYGQRQNAPFWLGSSDGLEQAEEMVEILEDAWMHGLNPQNYHLDEIKNLLAKPNVLKREALEVMLTDGFTRYIRDLSGIRVDPSSLRTSSEYWQQPLKADYVLGMLRSGKDVAEILKEAAPKSKTYKTLQQELVRLVDAGEPAYAHVLPLEFGYRYLQPGTRDKRIPDLRVRLGVEPLTEDTLLYDDRLVAAIIKFQQEKDLNDDGIIGPSTLSALNRTNESRIHQIIANLERLRWVEANRPDKFVIVNIPSATLWAVNDGSVEFEMPVIVGKAVRPTQTFITEIQGMRFNPDWTVPPTIKKADILPKLQADPNYLQDKGMELIRGHGANAQTLDPFSIDWENISRAELNDLRMVQGPGDHNPLGRFRVLMPNKYNIYLHDTNHPELFANAERAQSSGCVRLKDPERMARFIMDDQQGWDHGKIPGIMATYKTTDVKISNPIPVYILYYTTWVDGSGRLVFGHDIYGQDKKLIQLLKNVDGFYIPRHNQTRVAGSGRSVYASVN